ncbi:MAG TPA: hypothetical protein EYP14_04915, partial [Planctomycetaceae bacterium]|nr:hypothetical protein [Planctomycetaceae bacterium]
MAKGQWSVRAGASVIAWLVLFLPAGAEQPSPPGGPEDSAPEAYRANWPGFRGPFGHGVCSGRRPPLDWDGTSGRNVLWKVPVPLPGNGSPVVWGDRVFLTGATARKRAVYCFDADTGRLRWQRSIENVVGSAHKPPDVLAE